MIPITELINGPRIVSAGMPVFLFIWLSLKRAEGKMGKCLHCFGI